jgi:hypothetical protein
MKRSNTAWRLSGLGLLLLTFVAGLAIAQSIPDLSGHGYETRQAMELACSSKKLDGPVAYGTCLDRQIASLQGSSGIPSLSRYDRETRQSMELACSSKKLDGPTAYGTCLDRQIASLQGSSGIPSLSGYDRETRQLMELACSSKKLDGPVAYGTCLDRQIASLQDVGGKSSSQSQGQGQGQAIESQPQRASKQVSRNPSQLKTAQPQHAESRRARSAPADTTDFWYAAIPFAAILLVVALVYLLPMIWVLFSGRSRGGAKFGWFIVALCFSWLGLAAFLILTQASRNRPSTWQRANEPVLK